MILSEALDIKLGSQQVEKVYCGSRLIWEHESLPSGYQRCKYLESTGTQYISLQMTLDVCTNRFVLDVMPTKITGTNATASDYNGVMGRNNAPQIAWTKARWSVGNAGSSSSVIDAPVEYTRYTIEYSKNFVGDMWVNGIDTNLKRAGTMSCALFWTHSEPTNCFVRVYSAKSYDINGNLNFNVIPCLDTDGVPCMYDTVTKKTFYNVGTGDFLYELA